MFTQNGEENRADQADERFQIGHSHRNAAHDQYDACADRDLSQVVSLLGNFVFDLAPENLHWHVKLQPESKENRKSDQVLGHFSETVNQNNTLLLSVNKKQNPLCSHFSHWQIKRDARLHSVVEPKVTQKSYNGVQYHNSDHGRV